MRVVPVVLCGGVGSRLWPLSRVQFPKPCFALVDDEWSLLQQTVQRVVGCGFESLVVVCNEQHRFLVAQQLQALGVQGATIVLEPVSRNTAPAIALATLEAQCLFSDDALLLVLPADHVIRDDSAFHYAIQQAIPLANHGQALVTFGVAPTRAETGYGYIRTGEGFAVAEFVEKPSAEAAQSYLASGDYLWNSGVFLFRADVYLAELARYREDIFQSVSLAYAQRTVDVDFVRIGAEAFEACASASVDYAVIEHTNKAYVVPYNGDWSDIGAWDTLYDYADKDDQQNVLLGDVISEASTSCYVRSESRLVAAVGVHNLVIVETADAVLVIDKDRAQDVKHIVSRLNKGARQESQSHTKVHRPWGRYEVIDSGERFLVKRLVVKPGGKLSVQMHHHRAEHWVVVSGTAKVQNGDQAMLLSENQSTYIPIGVVHALENPTDKALELIEVQSGDYIGEDDIVRLRDAYGR
ncbi:mannose-1-phosphate guanylyltransferase/mannose-6-phosphate isomerase [Marinomonas sp. IMCC 4694]|uniref:mannose-1-phosphate guanylyltransferase/mannose-6-phosphate isomerase n=1 Tax=Marinomonas sp. IMCC 4694 TaxID=2605432 RepID=UPI0011E7C8FE|nr:mannose-1-phosphate guanylyltransferase/mannose-6-phosphate isomerase [Marinomonas sp. IMCC 4694]TYL46854.1 mannose-1-phosphate guanylyltransferase/mannose-6-phosphate isomerase [Marinomonas sp. IMCC 4694]